MKPCCEPKSDCTGGSGGSNMVYKMLIDLLAEGKLAIEGKFHFRWISLQVKFRGNPEGLGLRDHARSI